MNSEPKSIWVSNKVDLINRSWIKVQYNKGGSILGRCGGGWSYKFGIMGSPTTFVIELTWITIRIIYRG